MGESEWELRRLDEEALARYGTRVSTDSGGWPLRDSLEGDPTVDRGPGLTRRDARASQEDRPPLPPSAAESLTERRERELEAGDGPSWQRGSRAAHTAREIRDAVEEVARAEARREVRRQLDERYSRGGVDVQVQQGLKPLPSEVDRLVGRLEEVLGALQKFVSAWEDADVDNELLGKAAENAYRVLR